MALDFTGFPYLSFFPAHCVETEVPIFNIKLYADGIQNIRGKITPLSLRQKINQWKMKYNT